MNAEFYLLGKTGGMRMQFPDDYTKDTWLQVEADVKSAAQLLIRRNGEIMYYALVRRLPAVGDYVGIGLMYNGVMCTDVSALYRMLSQTVDEWWLHKSDDTLHESDWVDLKSGIGDRLSQLQFDMLPTLNLAQSSNLCKVLDVGDGKDAFLAAAKSYTHICIYDKDAHPLQRMATLKRESFTETEIQAEAPVENKSEPVIKSSSPRAVVPPQSPNTHVQSKQTGDSKWPGRILVLSVIAAVIFVLGMLVAGVSLWNEMHPAYSNYDDYDYEVADSVEVAEEPEEEYDAEQDEMMSNVNSQTITVNGVSFKMVQVQGGTFTMGATPEQGGDDNEKPAHQVTLGDYCIGQTEVTQALWRAVMGDNPSGFKGDNRPVECVSWDDCQDFIKKLNALTGRTFRLPTEAEWEYAARGGNKSKGYKYAGGDDIGSVAWYYEDNGTHDVATKSPNELGLYDMSGNVFEWCSDWYGTYSAAPQTNPTGPSSGLGRVSRGGSLGSLAHHCRVSARGGDDPDSRYIILGLRLVLIDCVIEEIEENDAEQDEMISNVNSQTITVNGVSFKMVQVQGGTFTMGATPEQGGDAYYNEKPAHRVTLSDYYIGQTEVTNALWQAVKGSNPSNFKGDNRPVVMVSWYGCQDFIEKLNALTGRTFRLPTEAEWEYAARGGNKSKGYKYAGSNNLDEVAWYYGNSGGQIHDVATKQPNELGLYDMSGNVNEWCSDCYGSYGSTLQTNPTGPASGSYRVNRGGTWGSDAQRCRVSARINLDPGFLCDIIGLRLVLLP